MPSNENHPPPENPFKPASLTPSRLRNDPAREVESSAIDSFDYPMISYDDASSPAERVSERRFNLTPLKEVRPLLRVEMSQNIKLTPIKVSPTQMQELRERRAEAREIGWTIDSASIRIQF